MAASQRLEAVSAPVRTVHTFTIPKGLATEVQTVGFHQLTTSEERQALKAASGDTAKAMYEQIKHSIAEVNGKPVSVADGSTDKVWETMDPRVRTLCMAAYQKLHIPENDAVEDFLKSQAHRVG